MKTSSMAQTMPSAHVAINKSRLKAYNASTVPTYYLKNGSEFQIELFNPTNGTILAKIKLDNEFITQGGLVLRPGERVFLERYIDIAKKFLFETYEVSANDEQVKQAIKNNGNLRVEFFKEIIPISNSTIWIQPNNWLYPNNWQYTAGIHNSTNIGGAHTTDLKNVNTNFNNTNLVNYSNSNDVTFTSSSYNNETEFLSCDETFDIKPSLSKRGMVKSKKTMETGRVEHGGISSQKLDTVDKTFASWHFHSIEAKLLPVSQKINAVEDIAVNAYCTECGCKQKKGFKFCPSCGTKN